jgi:hypothetical protein
MNRLAQSVCVLLLSWSSYASQSTGSVDFEKTIFPILRRSCIGCHGPALQQARLRLDARDIVFQGGVSGPALIPGKSEESLLFRRITASHGYSPMPPAGPRLTPDQVGLIRSWIDQGAVWPANVGARNAVIKRHWAYVVPVRPGVPPVRTGNWPRGPLDSFILARLEKEELPPMPEASRETLIRRLSFDLTGLPPSPRDVDQFLNDTSPDAYEKLVDRLLSSPHYGERWSQLWLDLSRYADSNGYESDEPREMWAWRDWVIDAFNRNLPFDRFTVEQLAGDLLDHPTENQIIATGFHRNTLVNSEAGAKEDEYRDAAVKDRVDTTATVWMGSTIACAQCHNHKYDPFTQRDYYGLYAFFNSTAESSLKLTEQITVFKGDAAGRERHLAALRPLEVLLNTQTGELDAAQARWEKSFRGNIPLFESSWRTLDPAARKTSLKTLTGIRVETSEKADPELQVWTEEQLAAQQKWLDSRPELGSWQVIGPFPAFTPEQAHNTAFPPEREIRLDKAYEDGKLKWKERAEWKDAVRHQLDGYNAATYLYRRITTRSALPLWVSIGADYGVQVWLNGRNLLHTKALEELDPARGILRLDLSVGDNHLLLKYTNGPGYYFAYFRPFEGYELERRVKLSGFLLHQPLHSPGGFTLRTALKEFRVSVTDLPAEMLAEFQGATPEILASARIPVSSRTPAQCELVSAHFRSLTPLLAAPRDEYRTLKKKYDEFLNRNSTTTLVMRELPKPRETFLQERGDFLQPRETVLPAVPAILPPLPVSAPRNRLGLARWLVSREHPLTARVAVNHFWRAIFGRGLVATSEDFGSQGDPPVHPQLLDWLAVEFMECGWDVKALLRTIVTSSTYRQSSLLDGIHREKDPENKLLGRAPRYRLPAENVRDVVLSVSGLLNPNVGGPSVFPPLPPTVFDTVFVEGGFQSWDVATGPDRYRRGLYTFYKRTLTYPTFMTFDAPDRTVCTVNRPRSNTPLQALATLNDQAFVEAAGGLALRMLAAAEGDAAARIRHGFRMATSRWPQPAELQALLSLQQRTAGSYAGDPSSAAKLVAASAMQLPATLSPSSAAPWVVVANVLLNLEETMSRE